MQWAHKTTSEAGEQYAPDAVVDTD